MVVVVEDVVVVVDGVVVVVVDVVTEEGHCPSVGYTSPWRRCAGTDFTLTRIRW